MAKKSSNRYVVSILVADRVGILKDITSAVTDMGANIDGISQTVSTGYFTVILTATFTKSLSPKDISDAILHNFAKDEIEIVVRPYEEAAVKRAPVKGNRYAVTVTGKDRPGILKTVTTFLAGKGINIEDWYVEFVGQNVTHIGVISVPKLLDIKQTQEEFQQLLSPLGLDSFIQHENIFRATNEIGSIRSLIKSGR
ncbi:MAG: ACT domain-containing protein [Kiritimatiellae bacterium]|nr:ACT domain-containing protein [Kiritimatiellia bacterium]MDD5519804.1 ACT domain-containing protein [Kiritimatiellia bacterium]